MAEAEIESKIASFFDELIALQPPRSVHDSVDLAVWRKELPFDAVVADSRKGEWWTGVGQIIGRSDLIRMLYNQALLLDEEYSSGRIPIDVCCWALGEPTHPAATKIGGQPFLPINMADQWPTDSNGVRYDFVCQVCFSDSADLVETMQGQVLLAFSRHTGQKILSPEHDCYDEQDFVRFLAVDSDYSGELVDVSNATDIERSLTPLSSRIVRVWDYQDVPEDVDSTYAPNTLSPREWPCTKISGIPHWPQCWDGHIELGVDEQFIAQVGSVWFNSRTDWPFANVKELPETSTLGYPLKIAEYGVMHLWRDKRGFLWDYQQ